MEQLKTIKQYAEYAGVTPQSVYRRLQTEQNAAALEGHVVRKNGTTYLDEFAVQYLNESRRAAFAASPAARQELMLTELAAKAQGLQEENEALQKKLIDALERLAAATQSAAESKVAFLETKGRLELLEAHAADNDQLRTDLRQRSEEILELRGKVDDEIRKRQEAEQERTDAVRIQKEAEDARDAADQLRLEAEAARADAILSRDNLEGARAETEQLLQEARAEIQRLKGRGLLDRIFNR